MPRDYRIGLDENKCFGPVGPDPTNDQPEQAIEWIQLGAWLFAFVHGKLLSKSDRLHCETVPRDQKSSQVRQHREQSRDHHSDASRYRIILNSLIPEPAGVLMTHKRAVDQVPALRAICTIHSSIEWPKRESVNQSP